MEMPSPRRADLPRSRHGRPLTEEVQHLLQVKLIRDTCTATMAASLYAVSRRTLYRYLKAEGRTFRQVANEVRCEIACTLLAKTDMPLSQITEILNYSEVSAFSRALPGVGRVSPRRSGAAVIARAPDGYGVGPLEQDFVEVVDHSVKRPYRKAHSIPDVMRNYALMGQYTRMESVPAYGVAQPAEQGDDHRAGMALLAPAGAEGGRGQISPCHEYRIIRAASRRSARTSMLGASSGHRTGPSGTRRRAIRHSRGGLG